MAKSRKLQSYDDVDDKDVYKRQLYVSVLIDVYSRKIVGWAMGRRMQDLSLIHIFTTLKEALNLCTLLLKRPELLLLVRLQE